MEILEAISKEARFRNYSPRTIETYQKAVEKFFRYVKKTPKEVTKKDIREFLEIIAEKNSGASVHVYLNAIKFFFEDILRRNMHINIKYCKRAKTLPVVLTKEEVKRLIEAIENFKHRLMIELMYSAGLRVSELINLKVEDLEFSNSFGFVRHGKGNKDRLFIIADKINNKLKNIIKIEKLEKDNFLFLTNRKEKYSVRSLQEIIKKAVKNAYINKKVHCHTLRHSFATHLIENGNSVSEVQALLGHKSPETTMIYVHTASKNMINIKSPLDSL